MARLTKRVVDAADLGAAAYVIWDDEIKGYGLRIAPGGSKSSSCSIAPGAAGARPSTA